MKLKIFGLRVDKSPDVGKYPRVGTISAKIIECLEAEPADCGEVAVYLDTTEVKTRSLLCWLRNKGLIRHNGKSKYELVDPIGASLTYHKEDD